MALAGTESGLPFETTQALLDFWIGEVREKLFVDVFDNKACALLPWADTLRRTGLLWVWRGWGKVT